MPLLPIELVESLAITIRHPRRAHRRLRIPRHLPISLSLIAYTTAIRHFLSPLEAPRKPFLTGQLHHAIIVQFQP